MLLYMHMQHSWSPSAGHCLPPARFSRFFRHLNGGGAASKSATHHRRLSARDSLRKTDLSLCRFKGVDLGRWGGCNLN